MYRIHSPDLAPVMDSGEGDADGAGVLRLVAFHIGLSVVLLDRDAVNLFRYDAPAGGLCPRGQIEDPNKKSSGDVSTNPKQCYREAKYCTSSVMFALVVLLQICENTVPMESGCSKVRQTATLRVRGRWNQLPESCHGDTQISMSCPTP